MSYLSVQNRQPYPTSTDHFENGGDMMSGPPRGQHFQHHPSNSPYGVAPRPSSQAHMPGDMNSGDPGGRYYSGGYDARIGEGGPVSPDRQPAYIASHFAHPGGHMGGYGHPHQSPAQPSPNTDFRGHTRQPTWNSPAPSTPSYHMPQRSHAAHSHMSPGSGMASPQMDDMHRGWNRPASVLGKRSADHQLMNDRQGAAPSPVMYGGVPSGLPHPNSASSTEESILRQQQQQTQHSWGGMGGPRGHDGQDMDGRHSIAATPVREGRASSSPSASSSHAGAGAASASATPAHSTSVRHPPPNTQGGNQPNLVRTSQIPPQPSAGPSSTSFTNYSNKAMLKIHGDLTAMTTGWSPEEWTARRRLVQFTRWQDAHTINVQFRAITLQEFQPTSIVISCIYREERNECYVTSVDTIYLLEALIGTRFTVEEKNRIRRNLEGFKPQTVSKSKPESESFFKLIMMYPNPRPRNIEKDVKVFPWKILPSALRKIVGKYSATYAMPSDLHGSSGGGEPSNIGGPTPRDAPDATAQGAPGLLESHLPNDNSQGPPNTYYSEGQPVQQTRPPSLDFSQILAPHPYEPQFNGGHALGNSEDDGGYDASQHTVVGPGEEGHGAEEGDVIQGGGYPGHREPASEA